MDGGGELSADAWSDETDLDVEQSGGLAPYAKIIVYDAPNTNPGFIDLFYKAASDNLVDSLSVSWGEAEIYYYAALNAGEDDTGQYPRLRTGRWTGGARRHKTSRRSRT